MGLVTIAVFDNIPEALIAKSKLEFYGLKPFLCDTHTLSANFLYTQAIGGIRLQVIEDETNEALKILNDDDVATIDESYEPVDTCPKCGSDNILRKRLSAFLTLPAYYIFGVPLLNYTRGRLCNDCRHAWKRTTKMQCALVAKNR